MARIEPTARSMFRVAHSADLVYGQRSAEKISAHRDFSGSTPIPPGTVISLKPWKHNWPALGDSPAQVGREHFRRKGLAFSGAEV